MGCFSSISAMAADPLRPHHPEEYKKLLQWAEGAETILEIGSRYGFTLLDFAKQKPKRIVAVDLPGVGDWGCQGSEVELQKNVDKARDLGVEVYLFLGDSTDPEIIGNVRALGPYDFAFIDGDHRYDGVVKDWLNYGPISKKVVFHDIRKPVDLENQNLGVWRLWEELTGEAFIAKGSKMGIGLVQVEH